MPTQSDFYELSDNDLIIKDADAFILSISSISDERLFSTRVVEIITETTRELFDSNTSGVSLNAIAQRSQVIIDQENIDLDMPGYRKITMPQFEPSGGVTAALFIPIGYYAGVMGVAFVIGMYHGLGDS